MGGRDLLRYRWLTNEELKNPDFELRSYVSTLQKPKTGGDLGFGISDTITILVKKY